MCREPFASLKHPDCVVTAQLGAIDTVEDGEEEGTGRNRLQVLGQHMNISLGTTGLPRYEPGIRILDTEHMSTINKTLRSVNLLIQVSPTPNRG